jgi:CheY-like chemotaxis protein
MLHRPVSIRFYRFLSLLVGAWLLLSASATAQTTNWRDSLSTQMTLLAELTQAANFERAQVEANTFRTFLRRSYILCPAKAVPLVSGIYFQNKDRQNGLLFLGEIERDAQRDRNPGTRAELLAAIVREHERWGNADRATATADLLRVAQDTLSKRRVQVQTSHLQRRIDSLQRQLIAAQSVQEKTVTLQRDHLLALVGGALAAIFGLIWWNVRNGTRWRNRLENKELEHDLRMSTLRTPTYEPPVAGDSAEVATTVGSGTSAYQSTRREGPQFGDGNPPPIALIVEPNRQVALYVRSLLSDRYDIRMVSTASEGLKMANDLLPDLIVCDAQLNGQTGIEITRQIKLSERTNHIPVVLLSRYFGNDGRLDALRAGADAWFTRPVLDDEFGVTILRLLDGQKAQHEAFERYLQLYYTASRTPINNQFLAEVMACIEANLANPDFMPDEMARKVQLTNPHFVKKLRALTGKDPTQLIREVRLEKARFLLQNRAGTPQAIAEMVGFTNPGIFSLAFKEYFGEHTLLLQ